MAVFAPGDTPDTTDSAWRTRIPQGWQTFPDGSIGPPNQVGSDWNAPYRTQSGTNAPSPSQLRGVTGGSGMNYPATGNGGLQTTPGTSLNTTGPDSGAYTDPNTGQPQMLDDPNLPNKSNILGFNPASLFGGGNPLWKAAIAAGGAMTPTPAQTGEAPPGGWPSGLAQTPGPGGPPGPAPPGVGGPYVGGQGAGPQMGMPFPQNNQVSPQMGMPWAGNNNGQPLNAPAPGGMPWAGNNAGRPYGVGASGRAPVNMGHGAPGVVAPHPAIQAAAARAAAGQPASPFTMVLRPNAPANNQGGRGGGGTPLATALDLSGWRPQAAAPAPAAAPRARVAGPLAKNALPRRAAPAPYPVTGSGSPTPLIYQHGGVGPAQRPGLVGYGGAGVTQNDLDQIGVTQVMPP